MCYIHLQESMEIWLARTAPETIVSGTVSTTEDDGQTENTSPKRKASEDLENGLAKRSKVSGDNGVEETSSSIAQTVSTDAPALQGLVAQQAAKIQRLEADLGESETLRRGLVVDVIERNEKISQLELAVLQRENEKRDKLLLYQKKLEDDHKDRVATKFQAQKEHFEQRIAEVHAQYKEKADVKYQGYQEKVEDLKTQHAQDLTSKHASYQKRIDELKKKQAEALVAEKLALEKKITQNREKCQKIAADAKKFAAEKAAENKGIKEEYASLTKKNKAELKDAVARSKPDQVEAVKAKAAKIKEQSAELHKLQLDFEASEKHVKTCERAIDSLEHEKKTLQAIIDQNSVVIAALEADATAKGVELESATSAHDEEKEALLSRVDKVEKRWQVQYDVAQNTALKLKDQQRANFELRQMSSRRDQEMRVMTADLEGVKDELNQLKPGLYATAKVDGHGGGDEGVVGADTGVGEVVSATAIASTDGYELEQQP